MNRRDEKRLLSHTLPFWGGALGTRLAISHGESWESHLWWFVTMMLVYLLIVSSITYLVDRSRP